MIVPMKKISLIAVGNQKAQTLRRLRKLGLVHIEVTDEAVACAQTDALRSQLAQLENGMLLVADMAKTTTQRESAENDNALSIAADIAAVAEEQKHCRMQRLLIQNELLRLQNWGEVDPDALQALAQEGIALSLYEMPAAEYDALDASVITLVLARSKRSVRFVVLQMHNTAGNELPSALQNYHVALPTQSTAALRQQADACMARHKEIDDALLSHAADYQCMQQATAALQKELELQSYAESMAETQLSEQPQRKVSISYIRGYIEAEQLAAMQQAAKENAWGLLAEDPTEDDPVPTKLKNNPFISLIYPLTDFLGTVPGYFEYDISGWFLFFMLIFFGIIFGDGGYGLLVSAVAAIPIIGAWCKKQKPAPVFLLVLLFGASTILWGTITCTWFGIPAEHLPQWLQSISVPVFSNVYADQIWYPFWTNGEAGLTTSQNVQIFCFTLALIQLSVAHIKGAVRHGRSMQMLGDIGAVLQLVGMYYIVLSLVVNGAVFGFGLVISGVPIGTVAIALIGIGFVMHFVFANYEGSIGKSVFSSLRNIVSVLLGVVNVFSDIVSYIRLWAVGLAGAAISATVNELAGPFLGKFMFMIVAIIILIFGHGLNMILNVLSVVVHGIRLNTLEFSSHMDMSWSGRKFIPFEE